MRSQTVTILESVRDKADKELIPLSVFVELTRKCNLNCRHCYLPRRLRPASVSGAGQAGRVPDDSRTEMSTARILNLIDELHAAGCLFLILSGGEPLTRPDFLEICQKAHSANMVIYLFTNGTLVTEELARQLSRLNIFDVSLSIYGAKAQTHDRITRQKGSYQKTLKAASLLKDQDLSVRFKYIMMNENITEYEEMLNLSEKLNIPYDLDPMITPCDNGDLNPTKLRLRDQDLKNIYRSVIHNTQSEISRQGSPEGVSSRDPVGTGRDPKSATCSFGRSHCAINAYGDIYPCIQLPVSAGNILEKPFAEIWRDSPWFQEVRAFSIRKVPVCRECTLLPYCRRCPGLSYVEDGSLYAPSREACRHARAIRAATLTTRQQRLNILTG